MEDPDRKSHLRRETLRYLANRPACAFSTTMLKHGLARYHGVNDATLEEMTEAGTFLVSAKQDGEPLATGTMDPMGSAKFYQVTAAGVLWNERNP